VTIPKPGTPGEPRERIPSLDGLRALSILGVIAGHALATRHLEHPVRGLGIVLTYGSLGVRVFFAISGYLITTLLLREKDATGRIDLKSFYLRRSFRILPAYWLFLLAVLVVGAMVTTGQWLAGFFFLSNYIPVPSFMGHTWSLSVEEQFYLLWPSILMLTGRRGGVAVASVLWIIAPFCRILAHSSQTSESAFQTQCDALMVGCLLALWRAHHDGPFLRRLGSGVVAWFSAALLVVVYPVVGGAIAHRAPSLNFHAVGHSVESVAIASVLLWSIKSPSALVGRLLNSRPLVHVGLISYSLYMWQQPLLLQALKGASWWQIGVHVLLAFAAGELSYRLVETPMIAWGRRLRRQRLAPQNAAP
jgi:peptidoglycan/LPS O-acetylase OafA/YrhL